MTEPSSMRACCIQMAHGASFDENAARARARVDAAVARGAQLALLPEYWFATGPPDTAAQHAGAIRALYADASQHHDIIVAGNVIERKDGELVNVGVAYDAGALALEQPKIHPMPREAAAGVRGGAGLRATKLRSGLDVGMLVCADVLYPEAARVLALQGAQILLNPVMSPYRETDDTKGARDAIFIARAYDSGAFVLKAGGYRKPDGSAMPGIAGRSLIAAPWGLVARYHDDLAEELVIGDLDFARLAAFRKHQEGFPARRPEAYAGLL